MKRRMANSIRFLLPNNAFILFFLLSFYIGAGFFVLFSPPTWLHVQASTRRSWITNRLHREIHNIIKEGNPNCGGRVPSFAAVCPHCGG